MPDTTTRRGAKVKPADRRAIKAQTSFAPDLHRRWKESGLTIPQLVRQALDAIDEERHAITGTTR